MNQCTTSGKAIISAGGTLLQHVPTKDIFTTSICFGEKDRKTAYITLGGTGQLVTVQWDNPGLPLNFLSCNLSVGAGMIRIFTLQKGEIAYIYTISDS